MLHLYNAKGHTVKDIFTMLIEIQDNFSDNYVAHIPVFSMTLAFFLKCLALNLATR